MAGTTKHFFQHKSYEYRSGLEKLIQQQLQKAKVDYTYEVGRIAYTPQVKHYTPDFILSNGIVVETKGFFTSADRTKHKLLKEQNPDMDLRFVFQNSKTRLSKQSKTTYAAWCKTNGFQFADKLIPAIWLIERPEINRLSAVRRILVISKKKSEKD